MPARRSALSVPGSSERMLAKAPTLGADEIVVDLEDAVAAADKDAARALVASTLSRPVPGPAVAVRINALDSGLAHRDVIALVEAAGPHIDSLVVPKVESADDLRWLDRLLGMLGERAAAIRLQALVETAAGLARATEIAAGSDRVDAVILGYLDLAASLGRDVGGRATTWLHAQETVLVAARAAGVQAIDGPYLAIRDADGLRAAAEHAAALGYDGKWAVHPDQVPVVNEVFTPPPEELERARAIVAALEGGVPGAVEVDGQMVDEASRRLALHVLARGEAAR